MNVLCMSSCKESTGRFEVWKTNENIAVNESMRV